MTKNALFAPLFTLLCALALPMAGLAQDTSRSFRAEGADTAFALGARHIAMGGTGVATADDAYAVFYNPARMVEIARPTIAMDKQMGKTLRPYTFAGGVLPVDWLHDLGIDLAFGAARYNRVHARSSGKYSEDDLESIFLRYLLPEMKGDFDGDINSKTLVNRFAVAIAPRAIKGLSFGVNLDYVHCVSNSCGFEVESGGYVTRSVLATALSYGVSANYTASPRLTFGASFTDVDTVLDVKREHTDSTGTYSDTVESKLPKKLMLEAAYQLNDRLLLAGGWQKFWGEYGDYALNFESLHLGGEYTLTPRWTLRGGLWAPLKLESSLEKPLEAPFPFAPTLGVGWNRGGAQVDLALYAQPVMSFSRERPVAAVDLSVSWDF